MQGQLRHRNEELVLVQLKHGLCFTQHEDEQDDHELLLKHTGEKDGLYFAATANAIAKLADVKFAAITLPFHPPSPVAA